MNTRDYYLNINQIPFSEFSVQRQLEFKRLSQDGVKFQYIKGDGEWDYVIGDPMWVNDVYRVCPDDSFWSAESDEDDIAVIEKLLTAVDTNTEVLQGLTKRIDELVDDLMKDKPIDEPINEYPKLMKYTDDEDEFIVMFTNESVGVVVQINRGDQFSLGYRSESWSIGYFTECTDGVLLTNRKG